MPDGFVVETSTEYGINVRHVRERHLYLFAIETSQEGVRSVGAMSVRLGRRGKHLPDDFVADARAFANRAAQELGLLSPMTTAIVASAIEGESSVP